MKWDIFYSIWLCTHELSNLNQPHLCINGHTHTLWRHRMSSSVELLCGCCLRAHTDGPSICCTTKTPQLLGQSVCFSFTVSVLACTHIDMYTYTHIHTLSRAAPPFSWLSVLISTFLPRAHNLHHQVMRNRNTIRCLFTARGRHPIMWCAGYSGIDSWEDKSKVKNAGWVRRVTAGEWSR